MKKSIEILIIIIVVLIMLILLAIIFNWKIVSNLYGESDTIFKVLTLTLVIIGIILTLKRMRQTQDQIESTIDNNKFNNFYKHRELFFEWMKKESDSIKILDHQINLLDKFLENLYRIFYYNSYFDFKPTFSDQGKRFMDEITSNLNSSLLSNKIIEWPLLKEEVLKLYKSIGIFIYNEISTYTSKKIQEMEKKLFDVKQEYSTVVSKRLFSIYYFFSIIVSIQKFNGTIDLIPFTFIEENLNLYQQKFFPNNDSAFLSNYQ